jgi:hypothetical protein
MSLERDEAAQPGPSSLSTSFIILFSPLSPFLRFLCEAYTYSGHQKYIPRQKYIPFVHRRS